ncbi:hypothetical protein [Stenomitos frigidus]|uniref:hypothetical protein n=1 Tax=Stenomitos frigidus TaxID=1886765 RepID=UPI0015E73F72|nr:hypothetical protein [Stenomitos frigidus]
MVSHRPEQAIAPPFSTPSLYRLMCFSTSSRDSIAHFKLGPRAIVASSEWGWS